MGETAKAKVAVVTEYLDAAGVPYELVEHKPAMSAWAEAAVTHRPPDQVAKTVLLHEDGDGYVVVAIPATQRLDLHKVRELLGATRPLHFATEKEIARDFPVAEVGAVPPFGPMPPHAEIVDRRLMAEARILCPAGDHRHGVLVDPRQVVRITGATTADVCAD